MSKTKLLLWSDAPDGVTGLGRIIRELTGQLVNDPEITEKFEIATLGYRAQPTRNFPWFQYAHERQTPGYDWVRAVSDFCGGSLERTVVFPIMPASWLFDYFHPEFWAKDEQKLSSLVSEVNKRVEWWPYVAVESCSIEISLTTPDIDTLQKCKRILFYSKWGQDLARKGGIVGEWCHHGFDWKLFNGALKTGIVSTSSPEKVIGCVMTNQWRKRWAIAFEALKGIEPKPKFNIVIDRLINYWSIYQLAEANQQPVDATLSSPQFTDQMLAEFYSNCNLIMLPSYGEGFGYPVLEAQAAGVPVLVGDFGAQTELVHNPFMIVPSRGRETDGVNGLVKPWFSAEDWKEKIQKVLATPTTKEALSQHSKKWDWEFQFPKFKQWFLEGLK